MQYIFMVLVLALLFAIARLVRKLIWKEVVLDFFYNKKQAEELKSAMKRDYEDSTAWDIASRYIKAAIEEILKPRKSKFKTGDMIFILNIIRSDRKALPLSYDLYELLISYAISEMAYANPDREHWAEHISKDNATLKLNKAEYVALIDEMLKRLSAK